MKLTENAYRDVNIAFANEISLVCDSLGMDPWELIGLANRHPRVDILQPGPGVGGHCIAVDPWFIVHSAPDRTPLIRAARQVNGSKPLWVAEQVRAACQGIEAPVIACLGLAYKAEVLSAAVPSPGGPTTRGVTYCLATKVTILTHVSPTVFREGPVSVLLFAGRSANPRTRHLRKRRGEILARPGSRTRNVERHQRPRVESDPANHRAAKGGDSTCMASALRELRWCSSLRSACGWRGVTPSCIWTTICFRGSGQASVDQVFNVIEERDGHFHWPDLDVDLDIDRIQHPERYPLVAKVDR